MFKKARFFFIQTSKKIRYRILQQKNKNTYNFIKFNSYKFKISKKKSICNFASLSK